MKPVPKQIPYPANSLESSEMRLLRAVLRLAILDYLANGKGVATISSNPKMDKRRAKRWLFLDPVTPNSPPFSFGWVCQHLSDDYIGLAERIRAAVKTLKAQKKTLAGLQQSTHCKTMKLEAA